MAAKTELLAYSNSTPLDFCLLICINREVCRRKVDKRDELRARIVGAAARIIESEDQLRRVTRDLRKRVAQFDGVGGWIFRTFIANCNKYVIYTLK